MGVDASCTDPADGKIRCRAGQRIILDHVGRMAYPMRSDDRAQDRSLPGWIYRCLAELVKECAA